MHGNDSAYIRNRAITRIFEGASFNRIFIAVCATLLVFQSVGLAFALDLPIYANNTLIYEDGSKNFNWDQDDIYEVQNNNANSIYLIFLVNRCTYRVLSLTTGGSQVQGSIFYYPGAIQTEPKDYTNASYKTGVFIGFINAGTTFYVGVPSNQTKLYYYHFTNGYTGGTVARFQAKYWTETYGTSSYQSLTPPAPLSSMRLPNVTWTTPMGQVFTLGYHICAVEVPANFKGAFSIVYGSDSAVSKMYSNLGWITQNGQRYWTISNYQEYRYIKVRPYLLGVANASSNVRIFFNGQDVQTKYIALSDTKLITQKEDTYDVLGLDPEPEQIDTVPVTNISTETVFSTDSIFSFITNFQNKLKSFFSLLLAPLFKFGGKQ